MSKHWNSYWISIPYAICKERSVSLLILKYKGKFTAVCFCKHNEVKRVNTEPWLMEEILVAILYPSLFFVLLYNLPSTPVSFLSLWRERGQHKHACQGSDRTDLLCKLDFTGVFSPYILPLVLDSIFLSWNLYIFLSWKNANIKHIGYSRNFEVLPKKVITIFFIAWRSVMIMKKYVNSKICKSLMDILKNKTFACSFLNFELFYFFQMELNLCIKVTWKLRYFPI